jgi:DNA adenine methylase
LKPSYSPLRYPGGKQKLVPYFKQFILANQLFGCHLFELYAGGASISLAMLMDGLVSRVTLCEKDPLLYSFWFSVKNNSEELCEKILRLQVTLAKWRFYKNFLKIKHPNKESKMKLALACIFLNRSNYSGILKAGPIGGMKQESEYKIFCRFNKKRIVEQIKAISKFKKKITVKYVDALEFVKSASKKINNKTLLYFDPPYYLKGSSLYRYSYKENDHKSLAEITKKIRTPWFVSYDRHEKIIENFNGARISTLSINYELRHLENVDELIISNMKLPKRLKQNLNDCETLWDAKIKLDA